MLDPRTCPFVVIDVETTGLDPAQDRICEVGAIRMVGGGETDRFHTMVQPGRPISEAARRKTGITDDQVRDAPPFGQVAMELRRFLAGSVLVAQNAPFDLSFLNAEYVRAGSTRLALPVLDTIPLARAVDKGLGAYNLDALARYFRVEVRQRHRSLGDCEITGAVFWKCVESLRPRTVQDLLRVGEPARR